MGIRVGTILSTYYITCFDQRLLMHLSFIGNVTLSNCRSSEKGETKTSQCSRLGKLMLWDTYILPSSYWNTWIRSSLINIAKSVVKSICLLKQVPVLLTFPKTGLRMCTCRYCALCMYFGIWSSKRESTEYKTKKNTSYLINNKYLLVPYKGFWRLIIIFWLAVSLLIRTLHYM